MNCFIGLDMGTSAVKGALVSEAGETLATASGEYRYDVDTAKSSKLLAPEEFLNVCFDVVNRLAESCREGDVVAAICPCCASGNLVLLGEDGEPLIPIIGWQSAIPKADFDRYFTQEECDELYKKIGWRPFPGFPLAYLAWINENRRDLLDKAKTVCMTAEYFNYALTGKFGISPSMGTPFYLMDQAKGEYNREVLDRIGVCEEQLPPIFDKGTVVGTVTADAAKRVKLAEGTPVVLGSFDHPSCATGAGVYDKGEMLLSCGTSWVEFFPTDSRDFAIGTKFLVDRYMLSDSTYCVMCSISSISVKIDNLRRQLLGVISHREFDELSLKAPVGCNGLEFKFDENDAERAKGHDKYDIARAITESAAKMLKANLARAEERGLRADRITMVGGMTNSAVCVKIIAETLGRDIRVVNGVSAGAVGAAMLAGIGAGTFKGERDAFRKMNFKEVVYTA